MGDQKTQEEKEKEASEGPAGILAGILGMGASLGGMIPSLKKGPQTKELQRIQQGGGAGAALARQTASEAARRVVGASAAQPSSGRGGNLREGLRSADQIVQRGAQQAAVTGMRESAIATQMLRANELNRRRMFRGFGDKFGRGVSDMGAVLAAAKDQGETRLPDEAPRVPGELPELFDTDTGLAKQTAAQEQQGIIDQGTAGLQRLKGGQGPPAPGGTGRFAEPGSFTNAMGQAAASGTLQAPALSDEEVSVMQMENLKMVKDQAEKDFVGAVGTPTNQSTNRALQYGDQPEAPPSASSPFLADYLYNLASNYNAELGQGMSPIEVAKLLYLKGLVPIDWNRLGIAPMPLESSEDGQR